MKEEAFSLLIKGGGSLLILLACGGMAVQYTAGLDGYISSLCQIKQLIEMIRTELEYSAYPLTEIFSKIARIGPMSYCNCFLNLSEKMNQNTGIPFESLWKTAMNQFAKELHLKPQHLSLLLQLGGVLCDRNVSQITTGIQLFQEKWNVEIEKEQKELAQKKRIGQCVWVFSGVMLVILLL